MLTWLAYSLRWRVALARVLANTHLPFEEFVRAFPGDILLVQAQAVRLILALTFDEGPTGNDKYRATTNRGGRAELQVGTRVQSRMMSRSTSRMERPRFWPVNI